MNYREIIKWMGAACYLIGTILMWDPEIAAEWVTPWLLMLGGNTIWGIDSYLSNNKPWVAASIMFCFLDVVAIYIRIVGGM